MIHAYQKYNPVEFPSPTQEPPDLVSPAFESALAFGKFRRLTPEELAKAIRLDPSQIAGLGPSLDQLRAILEERKRKILSTFETNMALERAESAFKKSAKSIRATGRMKRLFSEAIQTQQLYLLEQMWYEIGDDNSPLAANVVNLMERLAEKYQVEELAAKYEFTGLELMTVPKALEVKKELEKIDELLRQLEEAAKTAQIGVIDMESLAEFTEPGDLQALEEMQRHIENLMREAAERQGLDEDEQGQFRLTPKAYRLFQGKLLDRIFSSLMPGKSGRHASIVSKEGSVELNETRSYEFGDSTASLDIVQSVINAMIRSEGRVPDRFQNSDLVVHRNRHSPKCATVVAMDMSGSMRYDGQYINVKRMALALQGLIQSEYPGDFLRFLEMYTFARPCLPGEIIDLMPKPVTIHQPFVRLKADLSQPDSIESAIPPHFTNIQHALRLARQQLAATDTLNRQIILITDGLPTAHFEDEWLFLLYPPEPRTEEATMREARSCKKEGIIINLFLVPSWSQSESDIRFAHRLARETGGRVFFTAGSDLDRVVLWDYVQNKKEILG